MLVNLIDCFILPSSKELTAVETKNITTIYQCFKKYFPTFNVYLVVLGGSKRHVVFGKHNQPVLSFKKNKNEILFGFRTEDKKIISTINKSYNHDKRICISKNEISENDLRPLVEITNSISKFKERMQGDSLFIYDDMPMNKDLKPSTGNIDPEGIIKQEIEHQYEEGARQLREALYFKRNTKLVMEAKNHYGYICQSCGFNFKETYGELGANYIECHHKNPLSERDTELYSTISDIDILCSNCHRMIHRKKPALKIDELKSMIKNITKT
ncbi:HNH endonuclease [uncultured Tolumonas sp.]|uniref:HNH endonuclease n=1 Tax=uncultured Tolumonas sp. TaxID=263765 RepID=UPI002A0A5598|nr:HNH endonuclease [uncultured Tolumonas sp.]